MGEEISVKATCNTLMQCNRGGPPGSHQPKTQWNRWRSSAGHNDQTLSLNHLVNNTNIAFKQSSFHEGRELLKICCVKFSQCF